MLHPVKLADGKVTPCNCCLCCMAEFTTWEFAGAGGAGTGTGGAGTETGGAGTGAGGAGTGTGGAGTGTGGAAIGTEGRVTTPSDELGRLGLSTRAVFRPLFKMSESLPLLVRCPFITPYSFDASMSRSLHNQMFIHPGLVQSAG